MAETKKIRIQYYRSKNSTPASIRLVVKGLGFTRLNQIVERVDNESIRGMVKAVPHLVRIRGKLVQKLLALALAYCWSRHFQQIHKSG